MYSELYSDKLFSSNEAVWFFFVLNEWINTECYNPKKKPKKQNKKKSAFISPVDGEWYVGLIVSIRLYTWNARLKV